MVSRPELVLIRSTHRIGYLMVFDAELFCTLLEPTRVHVVIFQILKCVHTWNPNKSSNSKFDQKNV